LNAQVNNLRNENMQLKSFLMAHRDCPVTQAQGLSGLQQMQQLNTISNFGSGNGPYDMAMAQRQAQLMNQQGMERRPS
jgi:ATF/CREB family transcription factor